VSRPTSWAEAATRLGSILASQEDADEWLRQAVGDEPMNRRERALKLQKLAGIILCLEDRGTDIAFEPFERAIVNGVFFGYLGVQLDGPEWRVQPHEPRPARDEISGDFDAPTSSERLREILAAADEAYAQRAKKRNHLPPGGIGGEGV
jgi:hypothetical protein